jgi:hypothetical protein
LRDSSRVSHEPAGICVRQRGADRFHEALSLLESIELEEEARGPSVLLRFTIELAERMAAELGCVGLVVDAMASAEEFYRRYGFVPLDVVEGAAPQRPEPTAMLLALGSVPRHR